MANSESSVELGVDTANVAPVERRNYPVKWYRSTFFNMTVLGLCNFSAPGIWGAMNSLGAGGLQTPQLVNAGNSLTFCLMVVTCYFSSVIVHYIGIKGALIFGTIGYAPYAAALYCNNRFGTEWFIYLGASLCGISAGVFWMAEAAIAIAYPEPWNKGKALGYWLSYRLGGQILGGAINLGLNADRDQAGQVTYTVYLIFIALQCVGPFISLLLNRPSKVQRKDGKKVVLAILDDPWFEVRATTKLFFTKRFLLILLWIGQAVFAEAVMFTYLSLWFSVRTRALGSLVSGLVAVTVGNLLGNYLDRTGISLRIRARSTFWTIAIIQGALWIWATVLVTEFHRTRPVYDWSSSGFGRGFALFVMLTTLFQVNYLFLYFIIGNLATDEAQVIRYAALLRGSESGWQAVSYGITSIKIFSEVGGVYWNFALWAVAVFPAWLVIREFGGTRQTAIEQTDSGIVTPPVKVDQTEAEQLDKGVLG
ncbi:hypothetical protein IQ06DRAFT_364001 [Phaeosphaeriaceae sp. SRC1lsM3a]|nr:hypothetical protein IQ06DRAFT_364001 [Stagonospora sp. SRC1lsM3a]